MDNVHIVNLSSYNRPKIQEDKRKEWVNYGDDNDFYTYLIAHSFFLPVVK